MSDDDRRRLERIHLAEPIPARVGDLDVRVLDIGLLGARVQHERPLEVGTTSTIEFSHEGNRVFAGCRVVRCDFQPILSEARGERVYFSGIEFESSDEEAGRALKRLIADHITRALEAQRANAKGAIAELAENVPFLRDSGARGKVRRSQPASYVCCRLGSDGVWKKAILSRPTQPHDGFTVRLGETEDEIDRLCRAYKEAGPELRKLIRLCAEMSAVEDEETLPPQNFLV